jgi:hypothetical protein
MMLSIDIDDAERSLMAKATVSLLIVMDKTIRRFESFPSPPRFALGKSEAQVL